MSDNILEGITRDTLMRLWSEDLGLPLLERSVDRTELYIADEVFLCGTGAQISPVTSIDRRVVADGGVGPITARISAAYFAAVRGEDERYRDWVRPVYTGGSKA